MLVRESSALVVLLQFCIYRRAGSTIFENFAILRMNCENINHENCGQLGEYKGVIKSVGNVAP